MGNKVDAGTLSPGIPGAVRQLKRADMIKCPQYIMVLSHYREDGSCKCDDPVEQAMMIKEWGYRKRDFPPVKSVANQGDQV